MIVTLNRTLLLIFIVLLLHSLGAMATGWNHTIMDEHGFRQAQTAITVEYLCKGGPWFAYETPVLGPPWSIPMEFPLYQWLVAMAVSIFRVPIDQAGRSISVLFFYASLPPLYSLLRRLGLTATQRLPFLILMVSSPLYIFWSRTVMIESCALFFGAVYLAAAARYLDAPKPAYAALTLLWGSLAALVKITTFYGFALCAIWFLLAERWFRKRPGNNARIHLIYAGSAVMVPFLFGYAWSLFAEAQRALNPLAGFLTLSALHKFEFGTLSQRVSARLWTVLWSRSLGDILGTNLLILPLAVCVPFLRRERVLCCVSAATFLAVQLTFANLHVVHNYYQYANGVFLVAALGFCIAGLLEPGGSARVLGLVLLGAAAVCGLYHYRTSFRLAQENDNLSLRPTAEAIQRNSNPDDVVMVYGMDWSSELPYASRRRAIMVRDGAPPEDPRIRRVLASLPNHRPGALVACLADRANPAEVRRRACAYGFDEAARFEDGLCSVYLPAAHPKAPASCGPPPDPKAPFGNLERPSAGAEIANPLVVAGWALSRAGVKQIGIYLDGRLVDTVRPGIPRPDFLKVQPRFRDSPDSGFFAKVDLTGISRGAHVLRVEIQANDGGSRELADFPVLLTK